jgi:hypothetical protein
MHVIALGHGGLLFGADQGCAVAIPAKITDLCLEKQGTISAVTGGARLERKPHGMRLRIDPL